MKWTSVEEKIITSVEPIEIAIQGSAEDKEVVRNMPKKRREKYKNDVIEMLDNFSGKNYD